MNTIKISSYERGQHFRKMISIYGAPLLILDCNTVRIQYQSLKHALPGVDFYYAVKSLSHSAVLETLAAQGAGFDIASSGEIEKIRAVKISPRRTIHTHPIKRDQDIRDALRYGCTTFVIDNADELLKFVPYKERVGLLLRVSFRSNSAVVDLSKKFGSSIEHAHELLKASAKLGIHIKGISFHTGSQCTDPEKMVEAVQACNVLIRTHRDLGAAPLSILDIGGGFPVSYDGTELDINSFCLPINRVLSQLPSYVSVIAEPGRFISGPSMTCVSSVMGRAMRQGMRWYYLDDGVYGSFSGQIYDHARYPLEIFSDRNKKFPSVLAGPTCDSIDVIAEDIYLPELNIGDIVAGHMMGAYTAASATEFNSFEKAKIVTLNQGNLPVFPGIAPSVPSVHCLSTGMNSRAIFCHPQGDLNSIKLGNTSPHL